MQRNATAATDSDNFRPELVEDEPRYLRRQKPVEIRRKKFGAKNLSNFRRITFWVLITAAAGVAIYFVGDFALFSPKMLLTKPDQIDLSGNQIVSRKPSLICLPAIRVRACSEFLWNSVEAKLSRSAGSNPPACSAFCQIACAWKLPSAPPSRLPATTIKSFSLTLMAFC